MRLIVTYMERDRATGELQEKNDEIDATLIRAFKLKSIYESSVLYEASADGDRWYPVFKQKQSVDLPSITDFLHHKTWTEGSIAVVKLMSDSLSLK